MFEQWVLLPSCNNMFQTEIIKLLVIRKLRTPLGPLGTACSELCTTIRRNVMLMRCH